MKITVVIDGMMCAHCEAHVKKALEAIPGVKSAKANHERGEAVVTASVEISEEALSAAVTEAGYVFKGVK